MTVFHPPRPISSLCGFATKQEKESWDALSDEAWLHGFQNGVTELDRGEEVLWDDLKKELRLND